MSFTKEEVQFIVDNYNTMSKKEIAEKLNTYPSRVASWCKYHGYSPKKLKFSESDVKFMKDNYDKMSYSDIGKHLGYTERQIRGKINHMNLTKIKDFNKKYFKTIDDSDKAYWLGFIYADGYIIRREENRNHELGIELNRNDEYHLQSFNKKLGNVHKIYQKHKDLYIANNKSMSHVDTSLIRIYSKDIVDDLYNHGIVQNKTNVSSIFPKMEGAFFMDFLRGYIDGDGCIYVSNTFSSSKVHITSCGREIFDYLSVALEKDYGIKSSIYKENDRKYRLNFRGEDMMKLLDLIYQDENCEKLERKYEKYLEIKSLYKGLPIRNAG